MKPDKISAMPRRPNGTGHVYQRRDTWWVKYYRFGKPYFESSHSKNRDVAVNLLQKRIGQVASGTFQGLTPERTTILQLVELVIEDYKFRGLHSLPTVEWQKKIIQKSIGSTPAAHFGAMVAKRYVIERRAQKTADATINRELALIRRGFTLAMHHDPPLVSRIPKIPRLREENVRQGFLEPEQYERLLTELPKRLKALFVCGYHIGSRKGELRNLRWDQVDFDAGLIRLAGSQTKNKKPRTMPIYGDMERWLRSQEKTAPEGSQWVFHVGRRRVGGHLKGWTEACERVGLAGLLFHDLRRSAVRNMKRAGVQDKVAMEISGHKTRSVFDRYDIIDEGDLETAGEKTARYFAQRKRERAAKLRRVK